MAVGFDQALSGGHVQQRDALLHAPAGDAEKALAVGLREAAVSFGDVGGDEDGGSVELVGEEEVTAGEGLGGRADGVGERYGFLVDDEFFEGEGDEVSVTEESRELKVDRRRGRLWRMTAVVTGGGLCLFYSLLSPALDFCPLPRAKNRRGRDSNPRYGEPYTGFRNQLLQPLGHLSMG